MDKETETGQVDTDRRNFLSTAGKFAVVTPPAMSLLLSTTLTSPAIAASGMGRGPKGNNGVGNGYDPQPPGNPPPNDTGPDMGPGNPDNKGGTPGNGGGNGNGNGG